LNNPFFSIIIPTFNSEKYINETLDSIYHQSLKDFEVLICDDGSIDKTIEFIKSHPLFASIKILHSDRSGGPAQPRNISITAATGRWICFLDSDDLWLPNKLETVKKFIGDAGLIFHSMGVIDKNGQLRGRLKGYKYKKPNVEDLLIIGNHIPTSSVCIRRELIQNKPLFDISPSLRGVEDFDFWIKLTSNNCKFKFIDQNLGLYREHDAGISKSPQQLKSIKKVYLTHLPACSNKGKKKKALGTLYYILGIHNSSEIAKKTGIKYFIKSFKFGNFPIKVKAVIRLLLLFFK
jgi:glycosyltransferase involved in cell wall biosynthesis